MVSLDISNAFCRVRHEGLLAKLPTIRFSPVLASWISCAPRRRTMLVSVDRVRLEPLRVNAGVSQGPVIQDQSR